MAKKGWLKAVVGIGAVAVAGKVAYDKLKAVREEYSKEESESVDAEVKKYNAVMDKKVVEVEDEEFTGCEIKTVLSNAVIDLGLATFEKDVYINFTSRFSNLTIILPEGVNVAMDVDKTMSGVNSRVENTDEEGINTVYIIGKALVSNVEVLPVNFYVDDDDDFEDVIEPSDDDDNSADVNETDVNVTDVNETDVNKAELNKAAEAVEEVKADVTDTADETVEAVKKAEAAIVDEIVEKVKEVKADITAEKTETAKPVEEPDSTVEVNLEEI